MNDWRTRIVPLGLLQAIGAACLILSAWAIHGGWYAIGAFGLALLALTELTARRPIDG
jgi:hypothetical protein